MQFGNVIQKNKLSLNNEIFSYLINIDRKSY